MKRSPPEVFEFGGVAVGNAEAIRIALAHVRRAAPAAGVLNDIVAIAMEEWRRRAR
jgi:hypothetical protein